jgi:hypothetical protein
MNSVDSAYRMNVAEIRHKSSLSEPGAPIATNGNTRLEARDSSRGSQFTWKD